MLWDGIERRSNTESTYSNDAIKRNAVCESCGQDIPNPIGRPKKKNALTNAERQKRFREKKKSHR